MSRFEPYTVNEIKALLLAQEERLDKHRLLDPLTSPIMAVVASWNPVNSRTAKSKTKFSNYRGHRGSSRSSSLHGARSFSFQPPPVDSWHSISTSSHPTCQICKKLGHSAEHCWQRYDPHPSNQAHANFTHLSLQDNESHASSLLGVFLIL